MEYLSSISSILLNSGVLVHLKYKKTANKIKKTPPSEASTAVMIRIVSSGISVVVTTGVKVVDSKEEVVFGDVLDGEIVDIALVVVDES